MRASKVESALIYSQLAENEPVGCFGLIGVQRGPIPDFCIVATVDPGDSSFILRFFVEREDAEKYASERGGHSEIPAHAVSLYPVGLSYQEVKEGPKA